jgi:signal transduction histidine kinase
VTDRFRRADVVNVLLLAGAYVVAARIGLSFEPVGGFASLVWAPSGIALVALVLHGLRLWPGVLLGAAAANAMVGAAWPVALVIGAGNSLGALAGAWALRRLRFDVQLHDTRSALQLVGVSLASAAIPASIGTAAIALGGPGTASAGDVWRAWWTGDVIGNLLIVPLVLVLDTRSAHAVPTRRRLEFVLLILVNVAVATLIFATPGVSATRPAAYVIFPPLIWAAVRFGSRGAVTAVTCSAAIAIFGTVMERGPFVREDLHLSLLGLQAFIGVTAGTFLVLGATIAERRAAALEAQRSRESAEEANRAKAEFLAVMSHELRTPLNAIGGFLELLLMGAQGQLTETQRNSLERIQRNQYHLLALINDLLAFTRLEAGKVVLNIVHTGVSEALDQVEPLIQPSFRRKQLVFTRLPIHPELRVKADPDKLSQILLNLLSNAAKYTDNGGSITVGASRQDGDVHIRVEDSGIGIPPDQLDNIFQPFFQVDRGRTRRYEGVGLGLTIARDLARAMGGDVTVESQLGKGTSVTVRLPRA